HHRGVRDDPVCQVCQHSSPTTNNQPPIDTLSHYFLDCPTTSEFWLLASRLLSATTNSSISPPTASELICGWPRISRMFPADLSITALACWQVHRARAEFIGDGSLTCPLTMLARWTAAVKERIRFDHK